MKVILCMNHILYVILNSLGYDNCNQMAETFFLNNQKNYNFVREKIISIEKNIVNVIIITTNILKLWGLRLFTQTHLSVLCSTSLQVTATRRAKIEHLPCCF